MGGRLQQYGPDALLTLRERQVLASIARGRSSREIGIELGLSENTIARHRANIMAKLDRHSVAALVAYAYESGLVDPRGADATLPAPVSERPASTGGDAAAASPRSRAEGSVEVAIVHDCALVRETLRVLLDGTPGFSVVAEAAALDRVGGIARRTRPDVLIVDMHVQGRSSVPTIRTIRDLWPDTYVLVLTTRNRGDDIRSAIRAGAYGYVMHDAGPEALIRCIRAVAAGRMYCRDAWPASRDAADATHAPARLPAPGSDAGLTAREIQVLSLVAAGHSSRAIGNDLHLSTRTVEAHRLNVMRKLDLHSTAELTRFAHDAGIVTSPSIRH